MTALRTYLILPLLLLLFLPAGAQDTLAQANVAAGVITVRRPPVPAGFAVKISYDYSANWKKRRWWERRSKAAFKDYKAWLSDPFPPIPVSVARNEGDSVRPARDSARAQSFKKLGDRPTVFGWDKYVSVIPYTFSWTDTTRLDSARFRYDIDKEGRAVCTPVPWGKADSSTRRFEQEAYSVMRTLWQWYPAQCVSNRTSKMTTCRCSVTVTVYAFGLDAEKPPAIIVDTRSLKQ